MFSRNFSDASPPVEVGTAALAIRSRCATLLLMNEEVMMIDCDPMSISIVVRCMSTVSTQLCNTGELDGPAVCRVHVELAIYEGHPIST